MQGVAGNGKGAGFRDFHQPITVVAHGDWGIDYLSQHINDGSLDLDPPYQRGHVWTLKQQQNFLGFVLEGGRPPEAFVRELAFDKPPFFEVVDGKQRMTALHKWWMGEISAKLPTSGPPSPNGRKRMSTRKAKPSAVIASSAAISFWPSLVKYS